MTKKEPWRSRAKRVLDDYERGAIKSLTQGGLAKLVGVSRQTLWRDAGFRERFQRIQEAHARSGTKSVARASSEMRVRALSAEVARFRFENGLLIQNIVAICRRLREHGLDPHAFVGEAADDVNLLTTRSLDQ